MSEPSRADLKAIREEMGGAREVRRMPLAGFEIREVPNGTGGTWLLCCGYASVTCANENDLRNAYDMFDEVGPYKEAILAGAFRKTIQQGADVAFLTNHGGVTMARTKPGTLTLAEDSTGLHYEGRLNPNRPDVQILRAAIEDGAIDESSFAFRVLRQKWSYLEDNRVEDRRFIQEVDLHKGDVSPVNFGASEHTADYALTIRNKLFGGTSDTSRRETPGSGAPSVQLYVLPNFTHQAQVDLAAMRRH